MNKDFTISTYKKLLPALIEGGYHFQTYSEYIQNPQPKVILLRHDVDARKQHSLNLARIQHQFGVCGTYYFRIIPQSYDPEIIKEIEVMGHEIGYHYEDLDFTDGDIDKAYELAKKHLDKLRKIADIKTICMHGSPRSPYDNKEVWKKYDYRELGIIGEPYFDLDFDDIYYVTDTGRMWDGDKIVMRDRVKSTIFDHHFHTTFEIIESVKQGKFPDKVMMTFHPQRWTDNTFLWINELLTQSAKNTVKYGLQKYGTNK